MASLTLLHVIVYIHLQFNIVLTIYCLLNAMTSSILLLLVFLLLNKRKGYSLIAFACLLMFLSFFLSTLRAYEITNALWMYNIGLPGSFCCILFTLACLYRSMAKKAYNKTKTYFLTIGVFMEAFLMFTSLQLDGVFHLPIWILSIPLLICELLYVMLVLTRSISQQI